MYSILEMDIPDKIKKPAVLSTAGFIEYSV